MQSTASSTLRSVKPTSRSKSSTVLMASVVIALSTLSSHEAHAAAACTEPALQALRTALVAQNQAPVPLAPAIAYNGLNGTQISQNKADNSSENRYMAQTFAKLARAVRAFIDSNGSLDQTAVTSMGAANRRHIPLIVKRPQGNANASPNANCGSGDCQDFTIDVNQLHVLSNRSAKDIIDRISKYKLESIDSLDVRFCQTGQGCASKDDLAKVGGRVQEVKTAVPMALNAAYTVREIVSIPFFGKLDNTSIYKVTPVTMCGKTAYLMTGRATRDANTFVNSSSDILAFEYADRVLVYVATQGLAAKGRGPAQSIFLGTFKGKAFGTLANSFNSRAEILGDTARVNSSGMLK